MNKKGNMKSNFSYLIGGFLLLVSSILIIVNITFKQFSIEDALSEDGLFLSLGIFLIINNFIFKADEPNDERAKDIRMKSGYYAYLVSLVIIFIFLLLASYNVIEFSFAMLLTLLLAILTQPICLLIFNKKM